MIRRMQVQNFMCLKDVTIDFGPLTVFVGPNASGKSAIFKALVTLSRLLRQSAVRGPKGEFTLEPAVNLDYLVWQGNSGLPIGFQIWFLDDPDDSPSYTLELRKGQTGWGVSQERLRLGSKWFDSAKQAFEHETERRGTIAWQAPYRATLSHLVWPFRNDQKAADTVRPLLELVERFGEVWRYRPSANDIARFALATQENGERFYVRDNGWGLPVALQSLQGKNRLLFEKIEQDLCRVFEHIRFLAFESERFGVRIAFTTKRSEDLVPAPLESDGVLLTTFLLWRLHTAEANMRLCLEEPENGVHPHLLHQRFELIRRFSLGEANRDPVQILVATHSSDLLNTMAESLEPSELTGVLRVVEHDTEHGTSIHPLTDVGQIEMLLDVFDRDLGDLWWSGVLGGVPTIPEPEAAP